ncbi:hypothetical protein [Myroides injenensis]|uniref:hypothetical protein n=1 Tax=Myroides injenensis TaxID=1183151 RepID=UPI0002881855|nr:hypothetical protein [Myroides injenensis]
MSRYNELIFDERNKTVELITGLSEKADKVLTESITEMINAGMKVRAQVAASSIMDANLYIEGYEAKKGVYEALLKELLGL